MWLSSGVSESRASFKGRPDGSGEQGWQSHPRGKAQHSHKTQDIRIPLLGDSSRLSRLWLVLSLEGTCCLRPSYANLLIIERCKSGDLGSTATSGIWEEKHLRHSWRKGGTLCTKKSTEAQESSRTKGLKEYESEAVDDHIKVVFFISNGPVTHAYM